MKSKFVPHGHFSLDLAGKVLIIRVSGSWNMETSTLFNTASKRFVSKHFANRYFLALVISSNCFPTFDSIQTLNKTSLWAIDNGMRATAFCSSSSLESEALQKLVFPPQSLSYTNAIFSNEKAAMQWLNSLEFL